VNQDEATSLAKSVINQERQKFAPLLRRRAIVVAFMNRLGAGFLTLLGAYVGWHIAVTNPSLGIPPTVAGFFLGLVFAVLFPARKT
jgi:hypothetical protein